MSTDLSDGSPRASVPGATLISARALKRVASGIVRDAARVPVNDVSVDVSDDRGALRVSVVAPLALRTGHATTIVQDGEALRGGVIEGMHRLTGRTVSAVDVRYSGVVRNTERRVR